MRTAVRVVVLGVVPSLLVASLVYQFTGFGFIDSLGAAGLIYFSINEGREAFEKASGLNDCNCEDE